MRLRHITWLIGHGGDVQPYLSLALSLILKNDHRVRIATHPDFKDLILDANSRLKSAGRQGRLEFWDVGGSPKELMAYMVKSKPTKIRGTQSDKTRPGSLAWHRVLDERGYRFQAQDDRRYAGRLPSSLLLGRSCVRRRFRGRRLNQQPSSIRPCTCGGSPWSSTSAQLQYVLLTDHYYVLKLQPCPGARQPVLRILLSGSRVPMLSRA